MPAPQPERLAIVHNPSKRRSATALAAVREAAARLGPGTPTVLETTVAEPGFAQAMRALEGGADRVVVIGGDGTLREVARAMLGSKAALGVVPVGTANIYAHNLRLPLRRIDDAARIAVAGPPRSVDLGLARVRDEAGEWGDELAFLVMAGIGHDAGTVAATSEITKSRLGWLAYAVPAARAALRAPTPMTVAVDGAAAREMAAWSVLAANCGRMRGGIVIAPGSRVDDGHLSVLEVTVRRADQWAAIAAKGLTRLAVPTTALSVQAAGEVTVETPAPLHVHLDGDPVGLAHGLRAWVIPGGIRIATSLSA